jgi:DNA-binding IclR family transcriptional regulator
VDIERGYGINNGELEPDSVGVAAPVFDARRTVVAALGVNALVPFRGNVEDLARHAVAAAAHASLELGFPPPLGTP